ncbi:MAG TPA: spore coat U domain-containing protein, partial [Variovorax sp.]|nr:spore coat U domain-containing protein [Variovorax sp.]
MTLFHRWSRPILGLLVCAAIFAWPAREASAATSCTATMSPLNFGSVDLVAGGTFETSATLDYTCTNNDNDVAYTRVCFNLGNGSASQAAQPGGAFDPRLLSFGSNLMQVRFYQAGTALIWGSTSQVVSNAYDVRVGPIPRRSGGSNGVVTGQYTLRGVISSGQASLPAGTYTSSFTGNHTNVRSTPAATNAGNVPDDCAAATQGSDDFGFNVTATVMNSCQVTANTLNFGAVDGIASATAINAQSTINITCSSQTPYKVMLLPLNNNSSTGAGLMKGDTSGNTDTVPYQLYRNSGRTQVWGNVVDTNNTTGTGNGAAQQM